MNGEITIIRDLKPGMKNMNVVFIILDMGRPNVTKEGHEVRTCKVADKTGSVNVSLWDEPGQLLQSGDICKLTKGYSSLWKGCLTLYCGKGGDILKIGEFCLVFSECPFMSEPNAEYLQSQQNKSQGEPRSLSPTSQMLLSGPPPLSPAPTNQSAPDVRPSPIPGGGNGVSANQPAPFQRGNRATPPLVPSVPPAVRPPTSNHTNGVNNASGGSRRIVRR